MAAYTENYGFTLPEADDTFDIADFNENFESIDTLMTENETQVEEINEKIGTPEEGETVFSLLKSGGSIIKSIQRVYYSIPLTTSESRIEINEVNPAKTFVIFERLQDNFTYNVKIVYELHADSLTFEHPSYSSSNYKDTLFGFWIVEFN